MSCLSDISKNIVSDCTTQGSGGNEIKAWLFKRSELQITYDVTNPSKITALALGSGEQGFTVLVSKKAINSGHDIVIEEQRANGYTHFISFPTYEFDAASVENIDSLDDLIVVVESKDKATGGDGTFRLYGAKQGLVKSADASRANDAYGSRPIELQTPPGSIEAYSNYTVLITDYATTLAALVALESVQP